MGIYEVKEMGLAQSSKAGILQRFPARRKRPHAKDGAGFNSSAK